MERLYPNVIHVILLLTFKNTDFGCFGLCIINLYIILHTVCCHQICHTRLVAFHRILADIHKTVWTVICPIFFLVNRPDVSIIGPENFCVTIRRFKFTLIRTANACHATNCLNDRKLVVLR